MIWAKKREEIHAIHPELETPTSQRSRARESQQPTEHHIPFQPGTKYIIYVEESSLTAISRGHHNLADFSK